jgi:hypothetical protein
VVIEDVRQVTLDSDTPSTQEAAFLASLAISRLPSWDLFTVYDGTGAYSPTDSPESAASVRAGLDQYAQLQRDLDLLRARAVKEKQINRRVDLNLEIQRMESVLGAIRNSLQEGAPS